METTRLFDNSETRYKLKRTSYAGFAAVRDIALKSRNSTLAEKIRLCKEQAKEWTSELAVNLSRKELNDLLKGFKTKDLTLLKDKSLQALLEDKKIEEDLSQVPYSSFESSAKVAEIIFETEAGEPLQISEDQADHLIIGNVQQAISEYIGRISITKEEQPELKKRGSFKAFADSSQDYNLGETSAGRIKRLNELQLQASVVANWEKQNICKDMGFDSEKNIPKTITHMISLQEYYARAAEIVLNGLELTEDTKQRIDLAEANRALSVFFGKSAGT